MTRSGRRERAAFDTNAEDLLTPTEVAIRYRVSTKTLTNWRYLGRGPASVRVGGMVRYRRVDVESFIDNGRQGG